MRQRGCVAYRSVVAKLEAQVEENEVHSAAPAFLGV